jgi:selenocysteine lyase/cysteine desulfurase
MDPEVIARWRDDTPGVARRIHLNNAGAAPMPISVLRAITSHLEREAYEGGYESADDAAPAIEAAYVAIAGLINAAARNIAVVENARSDSSRHSRHLTFGRAM